MDQNRPTKRLCPQGLVSDKEVSLPEQLLGPTEMKQILLYRLIKTL